MIPSQVLKAIIAAARKRDPESLEIWEDLRKRVLYSDEDLHILNKPARLVVQGSKRVSLAGLIQSGLSFAETDITKYVCKLWRHWQSLALQNLRQRS